MYHEMLLESLVVPEANFAGGADVLHHREVDYAGEVLGNFKGKFVVHMPQTKLTARYSTVDQLS